MLSIFSCLILKEPPLVCDFLALIYQDKRGCSLTSKTREAKSSDEMKIEMFGHHFYQDVNSTSFKRLFCCQAWWWLYYAVGWWLGNRREINPWI